MKIFSKEGRVLQEDVENKKEYGHNVKATMEFGRHEAPGKITEGPKAGMSADYLTEVGQEKSAAKSKNITEPNVKDYSSPKERAQETGDLGLQNVDESVRVINQRIADHGDNVTPGQKNDNEFIIRLKEELDTAKNFAAIMPEAKAWAAKEKEKDGSKDAYALIVQYYLDHPERAEELGVQTPEQCAEDIAYRASQEFKMTKHMYDNSNVRLRNFTHGPKLEPFLKEIIIQKSGQKGFKKLEEIGGALGPGESFKFKTVRNGNKFDVKLILRGEEYEIDQNRLEELAVNYRKRKKQKESIKSESLK